MATLARLWILLPGARADVPAPLLARLAARPLRAVVSTPNGAGHALAEQLAASSGTTHVLEAHLARPDAAASAVLDRLVELHADGELALVLDAPVLTALLADVLALGPQGARPFDITPGSLTALDWSTSEAAPRRTQLVGHDLDWLPPWNPGTPRSPYPGGPGAAGSSRA